MIDHFTNGSGGTDVVNKARIYALVRETSLGGVAVLIDVAFDLFAVSVRISN